MCSSALVLVLLLCLPVLLTRLLLLLLQLGLLYDVLITSILLLLLVRGICSCCCSMGLPGIWEVAAGWISGILKGGTSKRGSSGGSTSETWD
jgi:hypothetical protein